ncbi:MULTISPECIES: cofilin family protein [unclassified Streptomyces]|uniref:cofilin family protein n=1 Tax=unclassified Streptomyces TaxID=2593676 RepID=UPI002E2B09EE|nr:MULTISPECIES: cofilin family protein [unclassified Streptomyces]
MSSPVSFSEECRDALQHVKETREINTVVLRYEDAPGVLEVDVEANLTQDELVAALPADEPRLVVHELSFATPEGARRNEQLLILWMPPDADEQEAAYSSGYTALKEFLTDVRVHLTARRSDQLEYRRLVALAG